MSSHREAPETAGDPSADNTDVYAFVSPDAPDTVTLIANYIPFQLPDGGPNFNEFSDDVLYEIHVSNHGDAQADITYQFRFTTVVKDPTTFLYNTGPIAALNSPTWNRVQKYSVTKVTRSGRKTLIAKDMLCPPCNVGVRSTPNYPALAAKAVHSTTGGRKVFAGQRAEGFYVDLGSIFDLGDLRPFSSFHLIKSANTVGVDATAQLNVHSIAIQVPRRELARNGKTPKDPTAAASVIGVWASASRQTGLMIDTTGKRTPTGPFAQVSRLGMPLINEVINGVGQKDKWNASKPHGDKAYLKNYQHPGLSALLPVLYPKAFPHLKKLKKARADLVAILLTGIPKGVVPGFQNYTGPVKADMLRLNMAIPPGHKHNPGGLLAGDAAGFPNGRRVFDDVVAVELRALAGLTYALVDPTYKPDAAAAKVTDGTINRNNPYLKHFPYLGTPNSGSKVKPGASAA